MRLIDADAVYKILESCEIRKATIGNPLTDWEYGYTCGIERAESEIECAPIVDAVPVIRCKDCRFLREQYLCINGNNFPAHWCKQWAGIVPESGFCHLAERKEE